jgi:hypothetical protein
MRYVDVTWLRIRAAAVLANMMIKPSCSTGGQILNQLD